MQLNLRWRWFISCF